MDDSIQAINTKRMNTSINGFSADLSSFSAIILSAGFSSRMGSFKPLLPISGRAAIMHLLDSFIEAGISDIKVITGYRGKEIEKALAGYNVDIVQNPQYEKGMYTSVQKGVAAISPKQQAFFILPVDYPLIRPESIRKMALYWPLVQKKIVYPVFEERKGHPPLISTALIPEILAGDQPEGLRSILRKYREDSCLLEVDDYFINMDMDNKSDYFKLQYCYHQFLMLQAD